MLHQSDIPKGQFHDETTITMMELMIANIQQQIVLSKMMRKYDFKRSACIDKYFGMAFIYSEIHFS